ncbi:MAG: DUF1573 domain-containing protein [Candidatus Zixiibacteriota bacterium]
MASRTRFCETSLLKTGMVAICVLFATLPTLAQKGELSRARISFSETMWDFGYVPKTGKVIHTYQVKNIGQDTLIIGKVRTSCGCATTPLSRERIAPGASADMKVIFDPEKLIAGDQTTRKLQVVSNDPMDPIAEVRFTAKLGKTNSLVKIYPAGINFDTVSQDAGAARTVTLENISGEKLFMELIEGPADGVDIELPGNSLGPGEKVQMTLRLKEGASLGNLHTSVTLDFECSKIVRVSIPIAAVVAEE